MTNETAQHYLVTFALYMAGGEDRFVDTEDVAVKTNEIAPGSFSWRKYPEQINLELVRVCLSNAKKEDHGVLVSGSGRKGWTLTPAGLKWAKDSGRKLLTSGAYAGKKPGRGSVDSVRQSRELKRIKATKAWETWNQRVGEISRAAAQEVFRIDNYSKGEMLRLKVDRLQKTFIDDVEISEFLQELSDVILAGEEQ